MAGKQAKRRNEHHTKRLLQVTDELLARSIDSFGEGLASGKVKLTLADAIRLIQWSREMNPEEPAPRKVVWIDEVLRKPGADRG